MILKIHCLSRLEIIDSSLDFRTLLAPFPWCFIYQILTASFALKNNGNSQVSYAANNPIFVCSST